MYDELPPEAVDHMIKAFAHRVGLGPNPGKYEGPQVKSNQAWDEQLPGTSGSRKGGLGKRQSLVP
jgi:hypothetical protein